MPSSVRSLWRRHTTRSVIIIGSVVAVLVVGGASAWAVTTGSSADAGYRTATATVDTVQQTLDSTGTLEPVSQAKLPFQVNGQVSTVNVSVGQQVTAGQVLATLDTTSLEAAVTSAQSSVTSDEQKLSSDEASESSSSSSSSTSSSSGSAKGGSSGNIGAQQTALVADQHKADADAMQAAVDLAQANAACGTAGSSSGGAGALGGGTSGGGGSSPAPGGTGGTPSGSGTGGASCSADLQTALADQQKVSQDQQAVAKDEAALAASLGSSSSSSGSSAPAGSTKTAAATPSQVAADQATLDADKAALSEAQASLNQATLSSPIAGTVVSVGIVAGQNVSAGSTSAQIVVMTPGAYEVSTTVSVSNVGQVKVGDAATVTLDGTTTPLTGTVSQIGPPPTSSSSTSYPVVISIPQTLTGIHDGASAGVSIVLSAAKGAVAVPTSAVHHLSRTAYVTEIRNGTAQNITVQVGTVGDLLTQITSGVKAGDAVVLANMSTPLPSSNSTFPRIGGGLGGGLGGGGLSGGRFSGGGGAVRAG
jgi:RND family efflux transporter MFP subunit